MKKTILLVAGILIVAGIVVGGAWYWQGKMQANKNDFVTNVPNSNPIPAIPQNPATKPVTQPVPQPAVKSETDVLLEKVGLLMTLPAGETPSIATVTDANSFSNQAGFENAENGDKVLIYTNAKKAILYRPSINEIIVVTDITF